MSTREGFSQFSLSWWLCAHSKLGRTKSARKLPKQKHSPPFCFQFLPLDVTGKTQKFQDKFESDLFGRFWGHMYTHDIRTIWKLIVINVPIVISWTFLVTPHSFRVLITIERGIAVCLILIVGPKWAHSWKVFVIINYHTPHYKIWNWKLSALKVQGFAQNVQVFLFFYKRLRVPVS